MLPEDGVVPTKDEPALAMVLVPADDGGTQDPAPPAEGTATEAPRTQTSGEPAPSPADGGTTDSPTTEAPAPDASASPGTTGEDDTWVFPFDKPLAPEEGDNQALAVNTTDGTVTYDLAFALIWADGDEVTSVNEAHAYASCSDCVAVAVAFQVVLISEDAQVVVPQNLAVAANYDCYQCITAAVANQLVLTVPGEPGEEQLRALAGVWSRLIEFGRGIAGYSLAEITEQLETFKSEIITILGGAPVIATQPSPTTSPSDGTSEPASPADGSTSPTPSPSSTTPTSPAPTTAVPTTPVPTTTSPSSPTTSSTPSPTGTTTTTSPTTTASSPVPTTSGSSTTTSSPTSTSSPSASTSPSATSSSGASPARRRRRPAHPPEPVVSGTGLSGADHSAGQDHGVRRPLDAPRAAALGAVDLAVRGDPELLAAHRDGGAAECSPRRRARSCSPLRSWAT